MRTICFVIILVAGGMQASRAQEKCATVRRYNDRVAKDPSIAEKRQQIEAFTKDWVTAHSAYKGSSVVVTIPVVVHVIHAGEAIGTGANISDAQVHSQIDVLNEDFRLLNADSLDTNHAFWTLSADAKIEFCLAQQDEDGFFTTGIDRINGLSAFGSDVWDGTDFDDVVKPATQWNPDAYLNIWTTEFDPNGEDAETLGYSSFPDEAGTPTDGVVIAYLYFGLTSSASAPNDLGRTATHEIGHYFNLLHIWGDDFCGDDEVGDTPPQEFEHEGCPTFPDNANNNCGADADGEMFTNYMDYTDDACMVMFTLGQADRMAACIAGTRASLLTSPVCQAPVSTRDHIKNFSVGLHPNPVRDLLTVNYKTGDVRFCIYNSLGAVVHEGVQQNAASLQIDVAGFMNGCYFLQLEFEGGNRIVRKFTVAK